MTSPAPATIVLDPSGAAPLCPALGLYLKPIARVSISVSLPPLPSSPTSSPTSSRGRAVSNWEVMERLKAMAAGAGPATSLPGAVTSLPASPFAALRLARSSQQAVRFEGELEHRGLVPACLARLDGRAIKLSGVAQALRVRAAEAPPPAPPTPRTAGSDQPGSGSEPGSDGEPYDTIHLQGLPCRWFAPRGAHPGVANPTRGHGGQPSGAPSGVSSNSGVIGGVTNPRGHGAQASPAPNPAKTGSGSTNPGAVPGASGDVIPCDVISGDVITRDVIARDVITRDDVITHDDAVGPGVHEAGGGGGDVDPGVHDDGADPAMTPTPGSGVAAGVTLGSGVTAAGSGVASERPSEAILRQAFGAFGAIRRVDIPMLDPYRGETTGSAGSGVTGVTGVTVGSGVAGVAGPLGFGPGGPLLFEAFVQFRDPAGCARAMAALRGVKLMLRGEDGKAAACNFKVTLDATRHLSDAAIRRRQLERQKLRELELQREEQKRREREAEARARAEERRQREQEAQARARRREEKLRRREQRQRERESRRSRRRAARAAQEEQRRLQARVRLEERRLLLAQRALQSIRLVAALLGRAKAARLRQRQEERRRLQEAELRRVEREKARALGLQRRERELRQRLLGLLLGRADPGGAGPAGHAPGHAPDPGDPAPGTTGPAHAPATAAAMTGDLLRPVLDILHRRALARATPDPSPAAAGDPGDDPGEAKAVTSLETKAMTSPASEAMTSLASETMTSSENKAMTSPERKAMTSPTTRAMTSSASKTMTSSESKAMTSPARKAMTSPERKPMTSSATKAMTSPSSREMTSPMTSSPPQGEGLGDPGVDDDDRRRRHREGAREAPPPTPPPPRRRRGEEKKDRGGREREHRSRHGRHGRPPAPPPRSPRSRSPRSRSRSPRHHRGGAWSR